MPSNQQYRPLTKPRYGQRTGSGGRLSRLLRDPQLVPRAYRALTLISSAVIALSLLASLNDRLAGAFASVHDARRSSNRHSGTSAASSAGTQCDPFRLPGYMTLMPSGLATYRTYDASCNIKGYLPTLLSMLPASPYRTSALAPSQSVPASEVQDKMANRTVLLIGDETDHFLLQHFCTLVGQTTKTVDRTHPWGGSLLRVPREHARKTTDHTVSVSTDPGDNPLAHYCYEPTTDFLLTAAYHLGSDIADTFQSTPFWTAPALFEDRIHDLFLPYMDAMSRPQSQQQSNAEDPLPPPRTHSWPDAAILSSSFWDLARYAEEDSLMMRSLVDDLSEHRLLSWRSRYVDMLTTMQKAFPDSNLAWRSLHSPTDTEETTLEWWTGTQEKHDSPASSVSSSTERPLFHLNRIVALNAARKSTLHPTGDDVIKGRLDRTARLRADSVVDMDWGAVLMGQDHHQVDRLHPGLSPGGSVFVEMLLHQVL